MPLGAERTRAVLKERLDEAIDVVAPGDLEQKLVVGRREKVDLLRHRVGPERPFYRLSVGVLDPE